MARATNTSRSPSSTPEVDNHDGDPLAHPAGISGPVTGDVVGNVTGNLTGNVTGNLAGVVTASSTGAVAATRYVGGHATGAPTTGTFLAGDFVVTLTGLIYVCTVAGTPGTWVLAQTGAYVEVGKLLRPTGVIAETMPRTSIVDQTVLASQYQVFTLIWLDAGTLVSSIAFYSGTIGAGTPTNQWFSLYSLARAKLAVTADDTTTAWDALTRKELTVAAPYTVPTSGFYYVGCMVKATTVPYLFGAPTPAVAATTPPIIAGYDGTNTSLTDPASAPATAAALGVTMPSYAEIL